MFNLNIIVVVYIFLFSAEDFFSGETRRGLEWLVQKARNQKGDTLVRLNLCTLVRKPGNRSMEPFNTQASNTSFSSTSPPNEIIQR
jgi:hypothetical protein